MERREFAFTRDEAVCIVQALKHLRRYYQGVAQLGSKFERELASTRIDQLGSMIEQLEEALLEWPNELCMDSGGSGECTSLE